MQLQLLSEGLAVMYGVFSSDKLTVVSCRLCFSLNQPGKLI